MAEVLLFHHAQGLTSGVVAFADALRAAGHTVHTPDVYDGHTFDALDDGLAYAGGVGFEEVMDLGVAAADGLPEALVYIGLSLGVMAAQKLVQTRPGALGAVFVGSCLPVGEFGTWPAGVPLRIHGMDADPIFTDEGDLDAARELVAAVPDAELYLYPGDRHLFVDRSLADYDPEAAEVMLGRTVEFLSGR